MIRFASIQYKAAEVNQYNARHEKHSCPLVWGWYVVDVKFMEPKSCKVMRVLERKVWLC